MTDQPPTRNQLIEQAGHVGAFLSGARGVTVLKPWPEVAERLLTWMGERGWLADPEQPAALLSRLADLTEAAGKLRSTEWLRTCATLPMEEWPPAPGYKGPMVPAAEVEELRAELEEHKAIAARDEAAVNRARAERDALQARINVGLARLKEADHLSADWPPSLEDWSAYNSKLIHARAVLQGDQPTEPKTPGGFPYRQHPHDLCGSNVERQQVGDPGHCEDCCSVGHVVAHPDLGCGDVGCYRDHGPDCEPYVTPPDPSGRIVDHGPVTPFTDTDRGEQP